MHYLAEVRRGTEASLKIGRALIEAQKLLNHGQWLPWLRRRLRRHASQAGAAIYGKSHLRLDSLGMATREPGHQRGRTCRR